MSMKCIKQTSASPYKCSINIKKNYLYINSVTIQGGCAQEPKNNTSKKYKYLEIIKFS